MAMPVRKNTRVLNRKADAAALAHNAPLPRIAEKEPPTIPSPEEFLGTKAAGKTRGTKTSAHATAKFGIWVTNKGSEWVAQHHLDDILTMFTSDTGLTVSPNIAKQFLDSEGWKTKHRNVGRYTAENTMQVVALSVAHLYRRLGETMPKLFIDVLQGRPVDVDKLNAMQTEEVSHDIAPTTNGNAMSAQAHDS